LIPPEERRGSAHGLGAGDGSAYDTLRADFEDLGLNGYESRVLLALFQLGSATASQLARTCRIGRTSVYPVLESLTSKRLADALPGRLWTSAGREAVLARLLAGQEERLEYLRKRTEAAHELLARVPTDASGALPFVHLITGVDQIRANYERLLGSVQSELLMFVRPPYTWAWGDVNQAVLDMLGRGVTARVIYDRGHLEMPEAEALRREHAAYLAAGVQARVSDELPVKLAIFDRKVVIVIMENPILPETGYPTTQLIEHPGYARVQADAFEHRWAQARPYQLPR